MILMKKSINKSLQVIAERHQNHRDWKTGGIDEEPLETKKTKTENLNKLRRNGSLRKKPDSLLVESRCK